MSKQTPDILECKPIGIVESCYPDKFGTPRQPGLVENSKAFLRLNPEVQPELSLQGLEEYSHLWVLFHFHKNNNTRFHAKVHPPRLEGKTMGVFATRSPHRPNPIGLSILEIVSVEKNGVWVTGVDLVDGTPILDIKPYLPKIEAIPDAKSGWTDRAIPQDAEIEWSDEALNELSELQDHNNDAFKKAVTDTLRLDPRPLVYKMQKEGGPTYREVHAVRLLGADVHFKFTETNKVSILSVRKDLSN